MGEAGELLRGSRGRVETRAAATGRRNPVRLDSFGVGGRGEQSRDQATAGGHLRQGRCRPGRPLVPLSLQRPAHRSRLDRTGQRVTVGHRLPQPYRHLQVEHVPEYARGDAVPIQGKLQPGATPRRQSSIHFRPFRYSLVCCKTKTLSNGVELRARLASTRYC